MAIACAGSKSREHVARGNSYFDEKKFPEAIIAYRAALQADSKRGDARLKLAGAYMAVNDLKSALGEFVRAADLLPESVDAQVKAGQLLLYAGRFEDAKARADRAVALDPSNVDAQILRGNALARLKDFDAAIDEYQNAIALDPGQSSTYTNLGYLQLGQGKPDEAEATFQAAVSAAPKSVQARLALANFYWSTRRLPEAEATLKSALDLDEAEKTANRVLGLFYLSTNRVAEAEKYFIALARATQSGPSALALADYYLVAQRPADARQILQAQLRNDANYAAASVRLASLDAAEGHRAAALDRVDEVLRRQPKDSTALLLSGRLLLTDGKRAEARKRAEQVIANEPNSSAASIAWQMIGAIESSVDRRPEAVAAYQQALKRQPTSLVANLGLARLYLGAGEADKAATYARQVLQVRPGHPDASGILVRAAVAKGDLVQAAMDLSRLQKAIPDSIEIAKLNAMVQLASKKPEAARPFYERVLRVAPSDLEALEGISLIDIMAGRTQAAAARIENILKAATPGAGLLMLAARVEAANRNSEAAEKLLLQAIDSDPDRLPAYNLLASLYSREGRVREAIDRLGQILAKNPNSVGAETLTGILLEQQGRKDEAEKHYLRAIAINPRAPMPSNNLAWMYVVANKNLDEALRYAQAAQQAMPEQASFNDTVGWIYYRMNMADRAITYLGAAVKKQPLEAMLHFHLGMACVQSGDWGRARTELQRALTLRPDFDGSADARKALSIVGG